MPVLRRDKITATALSKCIAHLVNHQISHELLALQLLTILLEGKRCVSCVDDTNQYNGRQVEILAMKFIDR